MKDFKTSAGVEGCTQTIQDGKPFDVDGRRYVLTDSPGLFDIDMPVVNWLTMYNSSCIGG